MGRSMRYVCASTALLIVVACRDQGSAPTEPQAAGTPSFRTAFSGPPEVLRNAIIHRTVGAVAAERAARPARPTKSKELSYHGGTGGIGVETAPKVYLVLWGSQWNNNNDPSGESAILQSFFGGVGYLLIKFGLEPAPMLLGFVLGRLMEEKLRQALALSSGSFMTFVERPISAVLLILAGVVLVIAVLPTIRKSREEAFQE